MLIQTPEIAIFLGAGASCSDGAPSQSALFRAFFVESFKDYYRVAEEPSVLDRIVVLKNSTARFFERFFGFTPNASDETTVYPTFEEVLGIIDLALIRDEAFMGFEGNLSPHQGSASLRKARQEFVFLIALILDKTLQNPSKYHPLLVQKLRDGGLLDRCVFISFNYDILIDNALGSEQRDVCDYGIEFVDYSALRPSRATLLKLHGSLNWLYCSVCRTLRFTPGEKGVCRLVVDTPRCLCPKCNSLTVPIIVPPTYFKVMSNFFIQQIWHQAEHLISKCHTWIFCGYSFPDADMHVKYLLKRVQVNSPQHRSISVINWHPQKEPREADGESERYRRFFGTNVQVDYSKASFEQFAAEPTRFIFQK